MGQEKVYYGGQAVIEGVMMRGRDKLAIAVRSPQGEIVTAVHQIASLTDRHRWLKWPLIRGVVQLFEALVWGIRALSFSAQVAGEEHEQLT
ncbi:MAG: DUF1385 domain-containing protein, partial [Negativicutes bacterium]|nr:DUF1385 domain-containing protein [Negativicutes bacterium]